MATLPRRAESSRKGLRFDPTPGRVRYSERWLAALAGGATLSALAVARGGPGALAVLGSLGLAGGMYATLLEPRRPRLERITMSFSDLPAGLDGLRIGQISDLHLGQPYSTENARWVAQTIAAEQPDLLALTGDFVSYDHAIALLPEVLAPLANMRPPLGAFAIPGNHDYWEGVPEVATALAPLGIELLINEHRVLRYGEAQLALAAVDDMWDGTPDLDQALHGIEPGLFTLLLSHCPDLADEAAAAGVRVQLSGHTHGGHVLLPGLGSLVLPRYGWKYPVGHRRIGDLQLYVSRGASGIPLRFGCPPEATIITLRQG